MKTKINKLINDKEAVLINNNFLLYKNIYYKIDDIYSLKTTIEKIKMPTKTKFFIIISFIIGYFVFTDFNLSSFMFFVAFIIFVFYDIYIYSINCKKYVIDLIFKNNSELNIILYNKDIMEDIKNKILSRINEK